MEHPRRGGVRSASPTTASIPEPQEWRAGRGDHVRGRLLRRGPGGEIPARQHGHGRGSTAGFAGALRGGGNASIGTVASVNGKTIYLTDSSGNTVKVTLSSATKLTKSQGVSKASVRPGDTVVIQGLKSSNGTIAATSVSDSGASATRTGAGTNAGGSKATSSGTTG
jgi:hypothetical protein